MIAEKVYKSQVFVNSITPMRNVVWRNGSFDIAIFVPSALTNKARSIANYANNMLRVVSIFRFVSEASFACWDLVTLRSQPRSRIVILEAGTFEELMFPANFIPPKCQLVGTNRKYNNAKIPQCLTQALNDGSEEGKGNGEEDDVIHFEELLRMVANV